MPTCFLVTCKYSESLRNVSYVQTGQLVKSSASSFKHDILMQVDCQTNNVVYCLSCNKCQEQYIVETEKTLAVRFRQHRGYVRNREVQKATGEHFTKAGHKIYDMKITILEKIVSKDPQLRKIRESYYIKKFNTRYKGMNKKS